VLHRAAAAANGGGGGGLLGSPLSSSSSSSSSFSPIPDKKHLIELRERLDNTVGLGVVKAWIDSTIEDALRFCMAGERLPLRHILLSGRLGSGRRTVSYLPEGPLNYRYRDKAQQQQQQQQLAHPNKTTISY
jgi:hypothetical protein